MGKGKLIVLEGTDGAGKSTQIEIIKKHLTKKKLKFAFLHFPMYGDNEFSTVIAKFLQGEYGKADEVDPYFVANIYAMDRFMFLPKLLKLLKENDIVLLDRYVASNIAFQSAKFGNTIESESIMSWIESLEYDFLNLPVADLTMFLDVPISITSKRLADKREGQDREYLDGKEDIHEADIDFQERVRNAYISLANGDDPNYVIIKGYIVKPRDMNFDQAISRNINDIANDIINEIDNMLDGDKSTKLVLIETLANLRDTDSGKPFFDIEYLKDKILNHNK